MLNYRMFVVLGLFIMSNGMILGDEGNRPFVEEKLPGYTKKIVVPEEGLSDEEKRYLNAIAKMSEALASTKDVNAIATQISIDTHEIWGDTGSLHLEFNTNRGRGTPNTIILIMIKGLLVIGEMPPKAGGDPRPKTVRQEFWFRLIPNSRTGVDSHVHTFGQTRYYLHLN